MNYKDIEPSKKVTQSLEHLKKWDEASKNLVDYVCKMQKMHRIEDLPYHAINTLTMVNVLVNGSPEYFKKTLDEGILQAYSLINEDVARVLANRKKYQNLTVDFMFPDLAKLLLATESDFDRTVQARIEAYVHLTEMENSKEKKI